MNTVSSTSRLATICVLLGIAATASDSWGQTRAAELMPIDSTRVVVVDPGARSLARLRLANGNVVDFIDLLDGRVGVGEKATRGQGLAAIQASGDPLPVAGYDGWRRAQPDRLDRPAAFLWTDDRSNVVDLLLHRRSP